MSERAWVDGDRLHLPIPADPDALRSGGAELLNRLFHAFGSLPADNQIAEITRFERFLGGGTGQKAQLSVRYARPDPDLPEDLFVKFSRDFDDPIRDRTRFHMGPEVKFGILSSVPGFPIAVPKCLFADFHRESGTGILISERIAFGVDPIERHYPKCSDEHMPEPLAHYEALMMATARLAGTHKAGKLAPDLAQQFPFDLDKVLSSDHVPEPAHLAKKIARIAALAKSNPGLMPENIRSPAFLARIAQQGAEFHALESEIKRFLHSNPDLIALCHWNANVDNAWFWRDPEGAIQCGLIDWGSVGQMNLALTLWGCLSGAPTAIWNEHLDALLALFIREFGNRGGPALELAEVKCHLILSVANMGLAYLTDAPARIAPEVPDLAEIDCPYDPRFTQSETARTQLLMMCNFLNLLERNDLGQAMAQVKAGFSSGIHGAERKLSAGC